MLDRVKIEKTEETARKGSFFLYLQEYSLNLEEHLSLSPSLSFALTQNSHFSRLSPAKQGKELNSLRSLSTLSCLYPLHTYDLSLFAVCIYTGHYTRNIGSMTTRRMQRSNFCWCEKSRETREQTPRQSVVEEEERV